MNTFAGSLLAASTVLLMPALAAAAEPVQPMPPGPPPGQGQDLQRRLEEARARLEQATSDVARLSGELGSGFVYRILAQGPEPTPRVLLGVNIDRGDADIAGAHVRDVSPGSAAAEAGIKSGDVITRIGDKDLTTTTDPARALVDKMQQVEPNVKLQVEVLRDGRKLTLDVAPRPMPQSVLAASPYLRNSPPGRDLELQNRMGVMVNPGVPGERRVEIRTLGNGPDDGTRFRGVEFATLSEKLGSYFGVKSGVLVVRAGPNPAFKLQDGDVILAIDGREPTSAQHAARILRSYGDGEKFTLRVQRDRKAQDIQVTMPTGGPEDMLR